MAHPKLLIIIAQSGRMLAQSAAREGYIVRVADCFGDDDMLSVVDRYLQIPSLNLLSSSEWLQAILTLSDQQTCALICGTGVERFYSVFPQLPAHIQYAGTSAENIELLCDPTKWISLLEKLSLPYPLTQFHSPPISQDNWLAKSSAAWGGTHIVNAELASEKSDKYYQQQIKGISASVLFLTNGTDYKLLSLNQQLSRNPEQHNFSLQGIHNSFELDQQQQKFIQEALLKLTNHLELVGLMSLDFIVAVTGEIFLLEVNPRPTASCQLLPTNFPIIHWQLMSSSGVMPEINDELLIKKQLLWFCFAPKKIMIPANFAWPNYCFDIPAAGSIIEKNDIVCSLLLENNNTDKNEFNGHQCAKKLIENLTSYA